MCFLHCHGDARTPLVLSSNWHRAHLSLQVKLLWDSQSHSNQLLWTRNPMVGLWVGRTCFANQAAGEWDERGQWVKPGNHKEIKDKKCTKLLQMLVHSKDKIKQNSDCSVRCEKLCRHPETGRSLNGEKHQKVWEEETAGRKTHNSTWRARNPQITVITDQCKEKPHDGPGGGHSDWRRAE